MPRPRNRTQLAIQISPDLMEQLRAAASAQRRSVTSVVQEALEVALSGFRRLNPELLGLICWHGLGGIEFEGVFVSGSANIHCS